MMASLMTSLRIMGLLGFEYARQQRIMLVVFGFWILGFDLVMVIFHKGDDFSNFGALYQQQCLWGIVFAIFLASSLLKTERDSRRVLAILSKGISRVEYLGGQIIGISLLAGAYYVSATTLYWLIGRQFDFETHVAGMLIAGLLTCALASAVALFMGTWAHPLAASGITILVLMTPLMLLWDTEALVATPAAYYMQQIFRFDPIHPWNSPWAFWPIAVIETVAAWLAAAFVFERQDVAVPTE